MGKSKELEPKDDSKRLLSKQSSRKTKIVVISVLTGLLFLGAVISVCAYFTLSKTTPTRLTEVKLEEGETLTYQVEQNIEIQGGNVQKGMFNFALHAMLVFLFFHPNEKKQLFLTNAQNTF